MEAKTAAAALGLPESEAAGDAAPMPVEPVERALYELATGRAVTVQTVESADGVVVTTRQLAPDVAAAKALLPVLAPDRWRSDAAPQVAVQFVIAAPQPADSTAEWLAQVQPKLLK